MGERGSTGYGVVDCDFAVGSFGLTGLGGWTATAPRCGFGH